MLNRRSKISIAVSAVALAGVMGTANAAPLTTDSTLLLDMGGNPDASGACTTGSCFGMEVSPNFWIWTMFGGGNDGGFVVGKNQVSGGQELAPSGTNSTPGDISAAWFFFGAYGTFYGDNNSNSFSDTSNDGTTAMGDFNVAWNGGSIPMGAGSVNDYSITLDGAGGGSWSMDYTQTVCCGQFAGVNFWMLARGGVNEVIVDTNQPPAVNDVALNVDSGVTGNWTPDFSDPNATDTHTCAIGTNAANGNATVNADCSGGTYVSGDGYFGMDSFTYTVTDQAGASGTGTVSVTVNEIIVQPDCAETFPLVEITTIGGGQSPTVNAQVQTTFVGHIMTEAGLTRGGKNSVKICPGTTVDFTTTSSVGTESCIINAAATASTGTLAIGDKLICTNKPDGSDTDRFSIKSGI